MLSIVYTVKCYTWQSARVPWSSSACPGRADQSPCEQTPTGQTADVMRIEKMYILAHHEHMNNNFPLDLCQMLTQMQIHYQDC